MKVSIIIIKFVFFLVYALDDNSRTRIICIFLEFIDAILNELITNYLISVKSLFNIFNVFSEILKKMLKINTKTVKIKKNSLAEE